MRRRLAALMLVAAAAAGCQRSGVPGNEGVPANLQEANLSNIDAGGQAICSDCPPYDNYDGPPLG